MSSNFIASTSFSITTKASKIAYTIVNNEYLRQNALQGIEETPIKISKGLKVVGKYGGYIFTAYSVYDVDDQWRKGQISTPSMFVEQISNGIGVIPLYGTAWSVGWNFGQSYGPSTWYGENDYKWFE